MIKYGDVRIKRIKNDKNIFCYYLSKYSKNIESDDKIPAHTGVSRSSFNERDLHPLLCSFLNYSQDHLSRKVFKSRRTSEMGSSRYYWS